jgi:hypothetical protein
MRSCEALKSSTTCSSAGPSGPVKPFQNSRVTFASGSFVLFDAVPAPVQPVSTRVDAAAIAAPVTRAALRRGVRPRPLLWWMCMTSPSKFVQR